MQGIDSLRGPLLMKAEPVAKIGYKGMMSRKAIIIPGVINFIMAESVRFTPRLLVRKLVAGINKKMG
jgi:short-subunit dehydrogenase